MANAPIEWRRQPLEDLVQRPFVQLAKRADAEVAAGVLALFPPSVVPAGRVLVTRTGIDDGELDRGRKGDGPHRLIAHVDEQGFAAAPVDRRELIEQARARPREIGLGRVSDTDGCRVVERQIEQLGERAEQRDRESRTRSESGAEG